MEIRINQKISNLVKKYKFPILILIIGLVLMLFPGNKKDESSTVTQNENVTVQVSMEERLSGILSQVDGAGNVQVILTESAGEETLFQTDENSNRGENDNSIHRDTITVTDSNRNETGLVKQVMPPVYQGAIIVCQGADNPKIKLEIVEAVSRLTGLGANSISVLKMK